MLTWNCNIIDINECDILYHVKYTRHCDNCGHNDNKERTFCSVMKNGSTLDIDNWRCPNCGYLNITKIENK